MAHIKLPFPVLLVCIGALACGSGGPDGGCNSGNENNLCGGDSIPGDSNTLFDHSCNVLRVCATGCQWGTWTFDSSGNKLGVADSCAPCPRGTGLYCAGDGMVGDAGTLFQCTEDLLGANVTVAQVCASGCQIFPDGRADACADGG